MGAEEHYREGDKEDPIGAFAEDKHREDNADKWCNGIVGTCAGCADNSLGVCVVVDTQSISHKAEQHRCRNPLHIGK